MKSEGEASSSALMGRLFCIGTKSSVYSAAVHVVRLVIRIAFLILPLVVTARVRSQELNPQSAADYNLTAVSFADTSYGWVVGLKGSAWTTDGGQHWSQGPLGDFESVSVPNRTTVLATWINVPDMDHSYMAKSTNAGLIWDTLFETYHGGNSLWHFRKVTTSGLQRAWLIEGATFIADYVQAWRSRDGGASWLPLGFRCPEYTDVALAMDSSVACLVSGRVVMRSPNEGVNWYYDTVGSRYNSLALQGKAQVWVVGDSGRILHSTDLSSQISSQPTGLSANLNAVTAIDSLNLWVVGDHGTVIRTVDGGMTWTTVESGTTRNLNAVCLVDRDHGWIVGDSGTVLIYRRGGVTGIRRDAYSDPIEFEMEAFPNPFNPTTVTRYQLPVACDVKLSVYDLIGREVSVLVNERKDAGVHEVKFDGSNLASGVYFYRLEPGSFVETKKLLLVR